MTWFVTEAVEEFLAEAGEFLRAEPARNTVILSVTENLRRTAPPGPPPAPSDSPAGPPPAHPYAAGPLFGWWRPGSGRDAGGNTVGGAFMHTPDFPVFLTSVTSQAAAGLASELAAARRRVSGINAETRAAQAFADTWRQRTGESATVHRRMRLYRLGTLVRPDPWPEGMPRVATDRDRDLLTGWFEEFAIETDEPVAQDHAAAVDSRLSYDGLTVWVAGGTPVSVAALTRPVSGMARIGPVYTPPPLRGRGYAGGVTAAVSQAALDAGVTEVVLYTDLANPTSNALYERLGYRPVEDRVVLSFTPRINP